MIQASTGHITQGSTIGKQAHLGFGLLLGTLALLVATAGPAAAQFVDLAGGVAPLGGAVGDFGMAWGDYDGDGDLDLFISQASGGNRLIRNDGGGTWVDDTGGDLGGVGAGRAAGFADLDDDGDLDLVWVTSTSGELFRNDGGTFVLAATGAVSDGQGLALADFDVDGDVDIHVASFGTQSTLFRNDGGMAFVDVTASVGLNVAGFDRAGAWHDYDEDGDPDLYVVRSGQANSLFRNDGVAFVDVAASPLNYNSNSIGCAWADADNDGDADLFVASPLANGSRLFRNDGAGTFVNVTGGPPLNASSRGLAWGDFDLDGDLDLYKSRANVANQLFRNDGGGTFVNVASGPEADANVGVACGWGDQDGDGDPDLYVANPDTSSSLLLRNDQATGRHWLQVDLMGTVSNASAIGARVQVVAGAVMATQEVSVGHGYSGQNALRLTFGLGAGTSIDSLIVTWPSGIVQHVPPPAVDQRITITEPCLVDIAAVAGVADTGDNRAVAWGDYDNDGDQDAYVTGNGANRLYRNEGGMTFVDVAPSLGLDDAGDGGAATWADYNNDGLLDLFLANVQGGGSDRLYRNETGNSFTEIGSIAGVAATTNSRGGRWADYDLDGDLDLFLVDGNGGSANRLYRNDGSDTFVNVAGSVGLADGGDSRVAAWADHDGDGDPDLYLTKAGANRFYRNDSGVFVEIGGTAGVDNSDASHGAVWADYDNDGDLDLAVAGGNNPNQLYRNEGSDTFVNLAGSLGLNDSGPARDIRWTDVDLDGDLDLMVTQFELDDLLYRNDAGVFVETAAGLGVADSTGSRGAAWADADDDGDLDLYVANAATDRFYENTCAADGNHWLQLDLVGTVSNRSAIGARVRVVAGGVSQLREVEGGSGYRSQESLTQEFGLGAATAIDSVIVTWPSGCVQVVDPAPSVDTRVTILEVPQFTEDASMAAVDDGQNSRGVAWGDYDNDGDLDLYVSNTLASNTNRLYRNDGGTWVDATVAPLDESGDGRGIAWADADNDGDLDLYLSNWTDPNYLFRNDAGTLVDATTYPLSDDGDGDSREGEGFAWADYDNDGDLDIYLAKTSGNANELYRNDGASWVDVTPALLGDTGNSRSVAWADYDDDGDQDVYVANTGDTANKLFRNDAGTWVDASTGNLGTTDNTYGVAWGDYDNDGDLDLVQVNSNVANRLFRNDAGSLIDIPAGAVADTGNARGVAWGDYDNDGDLDLYIANTGGEANKLLRNDAGTWVDVLAGPLGDTGNGHGVAWGDYDNDGDLDLYLANANGSNRLFQNDATCGNHWLQVNLVGTVSNRSAIGARVRVVTGGVGQLRAVSGGSGLYSHDALTASFGLGSETVADSLVVTWPSGIVQVYTGVTADQRLTIHETSGISTGVPEGSPEPGGLRLANAPNPLRSGTVISYNLDTATRVELMVFDLRGRAVRTLVDAMLPPGTQKTRWDARDANGRPVAAGVYFYRLRTEEWAETGRMTVVR